MFVCVCVDTMQGKSVTDGSCICVWVIACTRGFGFSSYTNCSPQPPAVSEPPGRCCG